MSRHNKISGAAIAACLCAAGMSPLAMAHEAGELAGRVGIHNIDPKSDNHDVVGVDSAVGLTLALDYFVTPELAIDVLGAWPYKHDITLNADDSKVASTKHLPPTVSLVWYPHVSDVWSPFIGVGVNYTLFFDEKTRGALAGTDLKLKDSVGAAAVAGVELMVAPQWSVVADLRYMDLDTKAKLDGGSIGTVEIDPVVYGMYLSYRF